MCDIRRRNSVNSLLTAHCRERGQERDARLGELAVDRHEKLFPFSSGLTAQAQNSRHQRSVDPTMLRC